MTELQALNQRIKEARSRTEALLKKRYGQSRTLGNLQIPDRKRLYNLLIWEQRYNVSLEQILTILFDHYDQYQGVFEVRNTRRRMRQVGLPTPAKILMGKSSEQFLQSYLREMFPDQQHMILQKYQKQEALAEQYLNRENLYQQIKSVAEYETLDSYLKDYDRKMDKIYNRMTAIRTYLKRNTRNYRGNPWR